MSRRRSWRDGLATALQAVGVTKEPKPPAAEFDEFEEEEANPHCIDSVNDCLLGMDLATQRELAEMEQRVRSQVRGSFTAARRKRAGSPESPDAHTNAGFVKQPGVRLAGAPGSHVLVPAIGKRTNDKAGVMNGVVRCWAECCPTRHSSTCSP